MLFFDVILNLKFHEKNHNFFWSWVYVNDWSQMRISLKHLFCYCCDYTHMCNFTNGYALEQVE